MKHRFLLDVMILYHAIKGVDEHENPDSTAADLLRLIRENCHTVLVDRTLADKYWAHIKGLSSHPPLQTQVSLFIAEFIANSAKMKREESETPQLPAGVKVPREDEYVVRAALISHPIVVTAERELIDAINGQREVLGLEALSPSEALQRARDK